VIARLVTRPLTRLLLAAALATAALLGGCASAPAPPPSLPPALSPDLSPALAPDQDAPAGTAPMPAPVPAPAAPVFGQHPADPWEAFNRKVFAFNDALDEAIVRPIAIGYRDYVPEVVRKGVDNVFGNINDLWSAANHLLQGKVHGGIEQGFRFLTNTVIGLGGVLDVATDMRMQRQVEDFGQTLGRWGVGAGPFVVLPVFGPRTVRDTVGLLVDRQFDPDKWLATGNGRWALFGLELLSVRTNLLGVSTFLDQVAVDRYTFVRDAYLARRLDQVHDGAPPLERFEDVPDDEPPPPPAPAPPAMPPR
jgi:phospholipid-binding lipoprotein MlaA